MGLLKKPKKPAPPPIPAPQAVPETQTATPEEEARRAQRRSGYQRTILTGSLTPSTGKSTTLG